MNHIRFFASQPILKSLTVFAVLLVCLTGCSSSSDEYEPAGEVPFTEDDLQEVSFERSNEDNATVFESVEDQISVTVPDSALPESVGPDDLTSEAVYVSSENVFAIDFVLGPDGTEFEEKVELSWVGPWDPNAVIQIQAVSDDGVPVLTSIEDTEEIIENLVIVPSESGDEARYSLNVDHYSSWTVSVRSDNFGRLPVDQRNWINVHGWVSFGLTLVDERDLRSCFLFEILGRSMINADLENLRLCDDVLESFRKAEREAGASGSALISGEDVAAIAFASGMDIRSANFRHFDRDGDRDHGGVSGRTCQKVMIPENSTDIRFITSGDTQVVSLNTPYNCSEPDDNSRLQEIMARHGDVMLGTASVIPMVCVSNERDRERQQISGQIINFSTYYWDNSSEYSSTRESSYRRMLSLFLNLEPEDARERDESDGVSAGDARATGEGDYDDNFANFLTILPFSVDLICQASEQDPTPTPEPEPEPEPDATAPSAPTGVTATSSGANGATVSWTAPSDGGSAITGYTVASSPGLLTCTTTSTSCTITWDSSSVSYTFTVTATNAVGTSPASAASASVTTPAPANAPSAPTNVTAANSGANAATVSWTAPSDGGSAITAYTVTSSPGGLTCTATSTSCTVSGLATATSYTFTVTATNAVGTSPASAPSASLLVGGLPGEPQGINVNLIGPTEVAVDFMWPTNDGFGGDMGAQITGYRVQALWDGTVSGECTTTGGSFCSITGLMAGSEYSFTVEAQNRFGYGTKSTPITKTMPAE